MKSGFIAKIIKNIYGLKQAGRLEYEFIEKNLLQN